VASSGPHVGGSSSTPLTLFAAPKPFEGHISTIQLNALASWCRLSPRPRIVLVGDEAGVADAAERAGVEHVAHVERNEEGTPLLGSIMAAGERTGRPGAHYCLVNSDILLYPDFLDALARVRRRFPSYLMAGRGWNLNVTDRLGDAGLDSAHQSARKSARLRGTASAEYFAYSPEAFGAVPPFAIGRSGYDVWLLWRARDAGVPVIDSTRDVLAVHQQHQYHHVADPHMGSEAQRNRRLRGGPTHLDSLRDARYLLDSGRVRRNALSRGRVHHHLWMAKLAARSIRSR
jgi:hypothetical protein